MPRSILSVLFSFLPAGILSGGIFGSATSFAWSRRSFPPPFFSLAISPITSTSAKNLPAFAVGWQQFIFRCWRPTFCSPSSPCRGDRRPTARTGDRQRPDRRPTTDAPSSGRQMPVLASHVLLAFVTLPLVVLTLVPVFQRRWDKHRRIAKWTMPIWLYVSITGVLVYLMLYQWFPPASLAQPR